MKLLNLGCGTNFHEDWINIDFVSNSEKVISHNLLNGIPMENNSTDIVYHSHVLEHFSRDDGKLFLMECYRVLKSNGIIRIAVPDLETIAKEYLHQLELAIDGNSESKLNYNWIVLEMFDQMVRNTTGGKMKDYLYQPEIPNEDYVFSRIGLEGKKIRESYFNKKRHIFKDNYEKSNSLKKSLFRLKSRVKKYFKKKTGTKLNDYQTKALQIGQFRLGGEVHQCMYDRYSLTKLLEEVGFNKVRVCSAFESDIEYWDSYQLDAINDEIRKPDSLFMEARKL